jgi:hypothetical protein
MDDEVIGFGVQVRETGRKSLTLSPMRFVAAQANGGRSPSPGAC